MRKLYHEYFHIPEKGIMREKVFFARLAVSVACIVLCMAALGFNAYAFFASDVTSTMNVIKSAGYDVKVVAKDNNQNEIQPQAPVAPAAEGQTSTIPLNAKTYALQAGTYTFEMTKTENSSSTGYAMLTLTTAGKEGNSFFTLPIGGVFEGEGEAKKEIVTRTITVVVKQDTTISIVPCWGSYSGTDAITDLEMLYCDVSANKVGKIAKTEYSAMLAAEAAKQQQPLTTTSTENTTGEGATEQKQETQTGTENAENGSKEKNTEEKKLDVSNSEE